MQQALWLLGAAHHVWHAGVPAKGLIMADALSPDALRLRNMLCALVDGIKRGEVMLDGDEELCAGWLTSLLTGVRDTACAFGLSFSAKAATAAQHDHHTALMAARRCS